MDAAALIFLYAACAAGTLWLASRQIAPISRGAALLLAAAPLLVTGRGMITGGVTAPLDILYQAPPLSAHAADFGIGKARTPILGDVVYAMIPARLAVREALKEGRLPLWDPHGLGGAPLLAMQEHGMFHPFALAGLLLQAPQAWTLRLGLTLFLALLCGYLFFREIGCGEPAALFGSIAWGLSDFLVFLSGYAIGAAVAVFPLLLLGLRRLARSPSLHPAAIVVVALCLAVAAGHPESLLHTVAAAGIYFIVELAAAAPATRWRSVALAVAAGILALGVCAVLLIPFLEVVPVTFEHTVRTDWYARIKKSATLWESIRRIVPNLVPYSSGVSGQGLVEAGFGGPFGYVGAAALPFAIVGAMRRGRQKWVLLGLGIFGALLAARSPGVTDAVSALPLFDIALNERLSFLAAFAAAALAALGLDGIMSSGARRPLVAATIVTLAIVTGIFLRVWPKLLRQHMPPGYVAGRFLLQAIPLLLLLASVAVVMRRPRGTWPTVAAFFLILIAERSGEAPIYPTLPAAAFAPPLAILGPVPRGEPVRVAGRGFTFVPNMAALYDLEDARGYASMTLESLRETFPLWCVPQRNWFNRIDDPTRPFLAFLGVRYVLTRPEVAPPPGWPVRYRGAEGLLLENPGALPRVFVPKRIAAEPDPAYRLTRLTGIKDFAAEGIVSEPILGNGGGFIPNGTAKVTIADYRADKVVLEVDAAEPALVATSIPAWPGWKLTIDGVPSATVAYNHAFLGFRVPPGEHRARLVYLPDGFLIGAVISVATLLLCGAIWASRVRQTEWSTRRAVQPA